jgi:cystathionine beta-lyase
VRNFDERNAEQADDASVDPSCDFDLVVDCRQINSLKWSTYDDEVLPMWVADMDFPTPPVVIEELHKRVEHGIFGYEGAPPDLPEIIAERLARLYNWHVGPEAVVFVPGIVTGFNVATTGFVAPQDAVLVQTPVYMHILHAAQDAGIQGQSIPLSRDSAGGYAVDIERFETAVTEQTRLFLLCNPHNPVGRVFTDNELLGMAEVCLKHDLLICSDEIHCDLVYSGHKHTPIASLSPAIEARTITLMAPSKTFNIPGLKCGFAVIPNPTLRHQYQQARHHLVGGCNLLGYTAARAAYLHGQPWLTELLAYLESNRDLISDGLTSTMPELRMVAPEGTFLAWIDCRGAELPEPPQTFFLKHGRIAFNDGAAFGPGGEGFVRLNFGCPRDTLVEGLSRMRRALDTR